MTKTKFIIIVSGALLIAALLTRTFVQGKSLAALRDQNGRLRGQMEQVNELQKERDRVAQLDVEELSRLRKEHSELMRLRGEAGRLRDQVQRFQVNPKENPSPTNAASETPSPFSTVVATIHSTVPAGQTLMAGGWPAEAGKRSMFLVAPQIPETDGAPIILEVKLFEAAEENLAALGLEAVNNQTNDLSPGRILTAEDTQSLLQMVKEISSVKILSSPRLVVLDGQKGQVSVAHQVPVPGNLSQSVHAGTMIDFLPRLSPDRKTVELTMEAKTSQMNEPDR